MKNYLSYFQWGGPFNAISVGNVKVPPTKQAVKQIGKVLTVPLWPLAALQGCSSGYCNEPEKSVPVNRGNVYLQFGDDTYAEQLINNYMDNGYFKLNPDSVGGPIDHCSDKRSNCKGNAAQAVYYFRPGKKGPAMSNKEWQEKKWEVFKDPTYLEAIPATIFPNKKYEQRMDSVYPVYYTANPDSMNVFRYTVMTPPEENPTQLDKYAPGKPVYVRSATHL